MAAALLCGSAPAQTVYQCVGRNAAVSYQSAPCADGTTPRKTWDATPEPTPTPAQLREREIRRQKDRAESAFLARRAGTDRIDTPRGHLTRSAKTHDGSACEAAKAARQRTLDVVGLKRTYELLSRLDEQVRAACK